MTPEEILIFAVAFVGLLTIIVLMVFGFAMRAHRIKQVPYTPRSTPLTGYKALVMHRGVFYSPVANDSWHDNTIRANMIPTPDNTNGIYFFWQRDDPGMAEYIKPGSVVVRLELSGVVVAQERGGRAEFAKIMEVCNV